MLPTLVIGGYLGAGKTTLVNHLLRHASGQRIAVLVNDFGDINIDADLIRGQFGDVLELSGGCVCCSFGADLVGALMRVSARIPAPDVVLIETSGVAMPGAVARSARLVPGLSVLGVVAVLDAMTVQAQAQDRYVGGMVMQQIQEADLLLLNKVDLLSSAELIQTQTWLAGLNTTASRLDTSQSAVPTSFWTLLDDLRTPGGGGWTSDGRLRRPPMQDAATQFETRSFQLRTGVDVHTLKAELDGQVHVLRAKGWVEDAVGTSWLLQKVGSLCTLTPADAARAGKAAGQLVVISLKGEMPDGLLSNWSTGTTLR